MSNRLSVLLAAVVALLVQANCVHRPDVPPGTLRSDHCQLSEYCAKYGECVARNDRCVATHETMCHQSEVCWKKGLCALEGDRCVASFEGCLYSEICREGDKCDFREGRCEDARPPGDPALKVGGIVVMGLGGAVALGGLATVIGGLLCGLGNDCQDPQTIMKVGLGVAIGGAVSVLGAGLPMLLVGRIKKPRTMEQAAIPTITVSPSGAALQWSF